MHSIIYFTQIGLIQDSTIYYVIYMYVTLLTSREMTADVCARKLIRLYCNIDTGDGFRLDVLFDVSSGVSGGLVARK